MSSEESSPDPNTPNSNGNGKGTRYSPELGAAIRKEWKSDPDMSYAATVKIVGATQCAHTHEGYARPSQSAPGQIVSKVDTKKEGIPSPDLWDTVCMAFLEDAYLHYERIFRPVWRRPSRQRGAPSGRRRVCGSIGRPCRYR